MRNVIEIETEDGIHLYALEKIECKNGSTKIYGKPFKKLSDAIAALPNVINDKVTVHGEYISEINKEENR